MSVSVASIQDKLRNLARAAGKDFQLILTRYFQERLLFRLSQTRHRDNFILKGGALLYALEGEASRPTLDLDLLSMKIRLDKALFERIFQEIGQFEHLADGIQFDTEKVEVAEIMEQRRYAGLQIKIPASLGTMRQIMKIDIGFGDVVTPSPNEMTYPTLLDMDAPTIRAYSTETVIAEKFEAMIDLAESNSRMKDFYDVHQLLSKKRVNIETLKQAVAQTFKNRGTASRRGHPLFDPNFATDPDRLKLWENFLKRSKLDDSIAFSTVMQSICADLQPLFESIEP